MVVVNSRLFRLGTGHKIDGRSSAANVVYTGSSLLARIPIHLALTAFLVGFITNHAYLDNPTFRGMRQSLTESFDEIYILDLHGNVMKNKKSPDGTRDENIFNIRQGVAVTFLIKK